MLVVGPAEKKAGLTYKDGAKAVSEEQILSLAMLHGVQLVVSVALAYQQIASWHSSPVAAAPDAKKKQ